MQNFVALYKTNTHVVTTNVAEEGVIEYFKDSCEGKVVCIDGDVAIMEMAIPAIPDGWEIVYEDSMMSVFKITTEQMKKLTEDGDESDDSKAHK